MMFGGGDLRRMSVDGQPASPLSINSRALAVSVPSAHTHAGQSSPFPKEEKQNGMQAESIVNKSKKLEDDLLEMGGKIKHHEENVKYLKSLKNKLEETILDMQVALTKFHTTSLSKVENQDPAYVESEEETIQQILKYENSAAALVCRMRSNPETQLSDNALTKYVLGIVATLGKVEDSNLSRLLSEYLGLEKMLAVVCKTYEGFKALEVYAKYASVNDRFLVICLENLRPYSGELIADDPQRRLDLLKPRLINGETPPGFLGFAVNMVTIDNTNLYCTSKSGHSLRETLFYNLFSNLQVYKTKEDMLKARPFATHGAISLDGGLIRNPGVYSLGHHRRDMDVKFPCDSKRLNLPVNYFEIENRLKETKWKKDRTLEDMQREQDLLSYAKCNYEIKKREFVQCLAESSSYATQYQGNAGRVSTPR